MDSNASRAGEVERNVWWDKDSFAQQPVSQTPPLVVGQSAESTQRKRGASAPCRYWHRSNCAPKSPRRRSSYCVLSRFAQGSLARCNRRSIARVPGRLTLTQRVQSSSLAALTIQVAQTAAAAVIGFTLPGLLAEIASPYLVIVSSSFIEELRVRPHVPFLHFSSNIHGIKRFWMRRRFTASSFRFWGSAISGRLGQVTVLPQLKADRLCSVVDTTADSDPEQTVHKEDCRIPREVCKAEIEADVAGSDSVWLTSLCR